MTESDLVDRVKNDLVLVKRYPTNVTETGLSVELNNQTTSIFPIGIDDPIPWDADGVLALVDSDTIVYYSIKPM